VVSNSRHRLLFAATAASVIAGTACSQIIRMPFKERWPGGTVKEKGWFKHEDCAGTWKYYDTEGDLIKTIDWRTGTKTYFNHHWEPFDPLFAFIMAKADSLLNAHFDSAFVMANIRWDANSSAFYAQGRGYDWFEETLKEPDRFLLRYDIRFGKDWYAEAIEFEVDRSGQIIDDWEESILGFTVCGKTPGGCDLQVDRGSAKRISREHGLQANTGRYIQYLDWHRLDTTKGQWEGEYEWVVARLASKVKDGNETTWRYDGIVIDPWSGEFKKTITLRRHAIVESMGGAYSGLLRDDR